MPAAGLLQLNDVINACCEFLKSQLHPTNCLGIRLFADMHSCRDLMQAAHSYIEQHFTEVMSCEEFLQLSAESIIEFISSDRLSVPSEDKVRFIFDQIELDVLKFFDYIGLDGGKVGPKGLF